MLVTSTIILSQEFRFRILYAKKKTEKKTDCGYYEQNIEAPFWIFESSAAESIN